MSAAHFPLVLGVAGSNAALITFVVYIGAVFFLAWLSSRLLKKRSFLSEYFLGSRSLGTWSFALTFAATSASGGSFTGFPSLIYTHGWVLALWISSYMVFPLCTMGILGKRINQVARIAGSITVPDVIRDRFHSAPLGLLATGLIVFFMSFNLVGQFKAGSEILNTLLRDVEAFNATVGVVARVQTLVPWLDGVDPSYLLCLFSFAVAVIVYTTWGGFHAVVWTDVMQGFVMVGGVCLMLPLALMQVHGLATATEDIGEMTPPRLGFVEYRLDTPPAAHQAITSAWFTLPGEDDSETPRLLRINRTMTVPAGETAVADVKVVELTTPAEIERQLERLNSGEALERLNREVVRLKELQIEWLEANAPERRADVARLEDEIVQAQSNTVALLNAPQLNAGKIAESYLRDYAFGAGREGVYLTGPGPAPGKLPATSDEAREQELAESFGFLPLSLAFSFFFMWAISGTGQPANMVRLMAFKDATTLRRSIFVVAIYYSLVYLPIVTIFCCARIILPGMDLESDRIMPQMAVTLTTNIGQGWLAGLLVAAPFAAVMSTVDSFLLMISSALVRDLYQRNINPEVSERTIKRLSYLCTLLVGTVAMLVAVKPPQFLQNIIVYVGSGLASGFLAPIVFGVYWKRANAAGTGAGMVAGFLAHLSMYVAGTFVNGSFYTPYRLFNFDPILIGLIVSFTTVYVVTLLTPPPPEHLVRKYFYKNQGQPPEAPSANR